MNDHNRHVQPAPRSIGPIVKPDPKLRAHKRAFLLLVFYIPLVAIPWAITMVLAHRPLTKSTWNYAPGFTYKDYRLMKGWAGAIPILNAVAAILVIPITSSILAQAAVVFAQRRHSKQELSVRHLFSLADRAWGDLRGLHDMLWWNEKGSGPVQRFLFGGMALLVLGAVQYPLFQLLAPWEEFRITTCEETRYISESGYGTKCDFDYKNFPDLGYTKVGIDLEPAQQAVMSASYVIPRIRDDLASVSYRQVQPYLWEEVAGRWYNRGPSISQYNDEPYFVAALPSKTTTGVLREHIMRLNTSVSCTNMTLSEFPSTCSGSNPFKRTFEYSEGYGYPGNTTMEICAPGDQGKHPWTPSRNRQDLSEEVYFKFTGVLRYGNYDTAYRCTANTARGYFELGNVHNGGNYGPLLDKWPYQGSPHDGYQFNNYFPYEFNSDETSRSYWGYMPSEEDHVVGAARPTPDIDSDYDAPTYTNMTGPLMSSVLALFGQSSWAHAVENITSDVDPDSSFTPIPELANLIRPMCELVPFRYAGILSTNLLSSYSCNRDLGALKYTLNQVLSAWEQQSTILSQLQFAIFLSNQATLTSHLQDILPWGPETGREIYTASGLPVMRPNVSLPAQIVLSIIIGVQIIGLLCLGWWIYKWPTWTKTLDALAVARVAASLNPVLLPPFQVTGKKDLEKFRDVDGLIGVCENTDAIEHDRHTNVPRHDAAVESEIEMEALSVASTAGKEPTTSAVPAAPAPASSVTLGLGAPGLIVRRGKKQTAPTSQGAVDV